MRHLLSRSAIACVPLLFAVHAFADEVADRAAITRALASLNDSQTAAPFAAGGDAAAQLETLRGLHADGFRIDAPSMRPNLPAVHISHEPFGEATIDFSRAGTLSANRSIAFVTGDFALVEGSYSFQDAAGARQSAPLLFVMRKEGDMWKILSLRPLASKV